MIYRRIFPREYLRLCPMDCDRRRVVGAEALVDFVELGRAGGGACKDEGDIPALYCHLVRNPNERIPWDRIVEGISFQDREDFAGIKQCGYRARFHAIAAMHEGRAVGLAFFKTLRMDCKGYFTGLMYIGDADRGFVSSRYGMDMDFRKKGIARALLLLSHGITLEDAERDGRGTVAGAFCDSALAGRPDDAAGLRLGMLAKLGMFPMMFDIGGGQWMTPAIQPALQPNGRPLVLHMLFKPFAGLAGFKDGISQIERVLAAKIVSAYIRSYDALETDDPEIKLAKDSMLSRFDMARRVVLMRPEALPDIDSLARADPMLRVQLGRSQME